MASPKNVFINYPFDNAYDPIFRALVFAVFHCGCVARSALEESNSGEPRFEKIVRLIRQAELAIHDISRTELDRKSGLPRFNMPLELGLYLGATRFGPPRYRNKVCLILDRRPYRYQAFISDIGGQDIRAHLGKVPAAISAVRDWLATTLKEKRLPGGNEISRRYLLFRADLPRLCEKSKIDARCLIYSDYTNFVVTWLKNNPQ